MLQNIKSFFIRLRGRGSQKKKPKLTASDFTFAAEKVVIHMRKELGVELNYDEQSIEWLDGYLNRIRESMPKETIPGLAAALGAYVGESIIRTYGGAWTYFQEQERWGIRLIDGNAAFPSAKVYKQLESNDFDSVHSFFTIIPLIGKIASAPPNSTVYRASE
jgi:hypothetical protein